MWVCFYIAECFGIMVNTAYKTLWLHANGSDIGNDMHIEVSLVIFATDRIYGKIDAVPGFFTGEF